MKNLQVINQKRNKGEGWRLDRFRIDPENKMITLFMIQILPDVEEDYGDEFMKLAYEALEK